MIDDIFDIEAALDRFANGIALVIDDRLGDGKIIRDVFGRLAFAPSGPVLESESDQIDQTLRAAIGPYLAPSGPLLRSGSPLLESILQEHGILRRTKSGLPFRLLDRRLAGEDWMQRPPTIVPAVPRFAFFGLKGGVGRSTALAVSASDLASHGMNVLAVDLDLEAPGIGNILLSPDQRPQYGVLDWMAAGSAGLDLTNLIPDMIGGSPFTSSGGVVDVVPASGTSTGGMPSGFLSKLARAYTPGASGGRLRQASFTQKIELLLSDLSQFRRYDAILLDAPAGLHETSAASLLGLGAKSFLFGTNSSQTLTGYGILFATVRRLMKSWPEAPDLRDRFQMVHGRAVASTTDRAEFRASCWQLWLDNLYDGVGDEPDPSAFSFDLDEKDGPHYPWTISNSETYLSFDPQKDPSYLQSENYLPVFSDFLYRFRELAIGVHAL